MGNRLPSPIRGRTEARVLLQLAPVDNCINSIAKYGSMDPISCSVETIEEAMVLDIGRSFIPHELHAPDQVPGHVTGGYHLGDECHGDVTDTGL